MFFIRQLALVAVFSGAFASAQTFSFDRPNTKNNVSYLAEPTTVEVNKPKDVELYFRVVDALHINSHSPFATELVPTTLTLQATPDVKLGKMQYPVGTKYAFSFAPKEKLSVYTGDFVVKVRVTAARAGTFTVNGALRYQACDNAQCYPPKSLPITLIVNAR